MAKVPVAVMANFRARLARVVLRVRLVTRNEAFNKVHHVGMAELFGHQAPLVTGRANGLGDAQRAYAARRTEEDQ